MRLFILERPKYLVKSQRAAMMYSTTEQQMLSTMKHTIAQIFERELLPKILDNTFLKTTWVFFNHMFVTIHCAKAREIVHF